MKKKLSIVVLKKRKQWYWKLIHRNGQDLATSETYSSRYKACQTATGVMSSFKRGECTFQIKGGRNGDNKFSRISRL